ncbi:uncharacterized protein MONBRDRAFT_7253 [Monosiga brevicollis MX1]|uniref:C2H2-type domain-containing protein n=1 Tax=Monosiga brevicollis TaxID=81824 RepID=A9UWE6_MONBE|nr:uncharacterized protein MONBRDRAFT_7253 [Monosiga brevicollis MX1]EDQ90753.1 predicted protein [Monosiga brevicollis MX1]|eukprot:XP_001744804.1 hypothetical protein [Monosiga brevicollis MX1]
MARRVNWRKIGLVDVDALRSNGDMGPLQELLENVTFCDIYTEDLEGVDLNFIKLFRLAQLMLEHILHKQEDLLHQLQAREQEVAHLTEEAAAAHTRYQEEHKQHKTVKRTLKALQSSVGATQQGNATCQFCGKIFATRPFLVAHMQRRHAEYGPFPLIDPSAEDENRPRGRDNETHSAAATNKALQELQEQVRTLHEALARQRDEAARQLQQQLLNTTVAQQSLHQPSSTDTATKDRLTELERQLRDVQQEHGRQLQCVYHGPMFSNPSSCPAQLFSLPHGHCRQVARDQERAADERVRNLQRQHQDATLLASVASPRHRRTVATEQVDESSDSDDNRRHTAGRSAKAADQQLQQQVAALQQQLLNQQSQFQQQLERQAAQTQAVLQQARAPTEAHERGSSSELTQTLLQQQQQLASNLNASHRQREQELQTQLREQQRQLTTMQRSLARAQSQSFLSPDAPIAASRGMHRSRTSPNLPAVVAEPTTPARGDRNKSPSEKPRRPPPPADVRGSTPSKDREPRRARSRSASAGVQRTRSVSPPKRGRADDRQGRSRQRDATPSRDRPRMTMSLPRMRLPSFLKGLRRRTASTTDVGRREREEQERQATTYLDDVDWVSREKVFEARHAVVGNIEQRMALPKDQNAMKRSDFEYRLEGLPEPMGNRAEIRNDILRDLDEFVRATYEPTIVPTTLAAPAVLRLSPVPASHSEPRDTVAPIIVQPEPESASTPRANSGGSWGVEDDDQDIDDAQTVTRPPSTMPATLVVPNTKADLPSDDYEWDSSDVSALSDPPVDHVLVPANTGSTPAASRIQATTVAAAPAASASKTPGRTTKPPVHVLAQIFPGCSQRHKFGISFSTRDNE